jgi:hypothetical protein
VLHGGLFLAAMVTIMATDTIAADVKREVAGVSWREGSKTRMVNFG